MPNPHHRLYLAPALLGVALVAAAASCRRGGGPPRPAPEAAVLERQIESASALVAAARRGPLVPFQQILVTVDEKLVRELLDSATPYERVVADKYRVRLNSARVSFAGGLALVQLEGRASLAGRDEKTAFADVRVHGALDVLGLDPATGILRARVNVIAVEVPQVNVLGLSAPVRELVEDLTSEPVEKFNVLASNLEIPVAFEQEVQIPGVGPEGEVSIEAASVPLRVAVEDVKVMRGKIWIAVGVEVTDAVGARVSGDSAAPAAAVESGRRGGTAAADGRKAAAPAASPSSGGTPQRRGTAAGGAPGDTGSARLAELRRRYEALVDTLDALSAHDSLLAKVAADTGDVGVGIRPQLVDRLVREAAGRYLDRVVLDLPLEKDVHEGDEVRVKVLFAKVNAGRWDVHVTVHRVRAVLVAREPRLSVAGENRLRIVLPVSVTEGTGTATVRFQWDAKGIANAACHDFSTKLDVMGNAVPRDYEITGDLVLSAEGDRIVARPDFSVQKIRVSVSPTRESWDKVRSTLAYLDSFGKCGIGLDILSPDKVVKLLDGVLGKGFDIKLPTKLVPTLELPASISESVQVEGRTVNLSVKPHGLRVGPEALWYSARVDAGVAPVRASSAQ